MPYVRDSFWRGRQFTSELQMQTDGLRWSREVAGQRSCRPLGGAAPAAVFAATEQHTLQPLPVRAFELASWSRPKVGPDIHVKVGKGLYSVPWRFIGQHLDARASDSHVQLFHAGELVKTHITAVGKGRVTDYGDYPPEKIAFHMRTPIWCRQRAAEIGPATVALIDELLEVNALFRLRAAQGVLGLADKHTPERLEDENDNFIWPHCDGLIWPHPRGCVLVPGASLVTVCERRGRHGLVSQRRLACSRRGWSAAGRSRCRSG